MVSDNEYANIDFKLNSYMKTENPRLITAMKARRLARSMKVQIYLNLPGLALLKITLMISLNLRGT